MRSKWGTQCAKQHTWFGADCPTGANGCELALGYLRRMVSFRQAQGRHGLDPTAFWDGAVLGLTSSA